MGKMVTFLFICTKICSFVQIRVNVQNGEISDFSSIEHFFCSFALKYVHLYTNYRFYVKTN